MTSPHSTDPQDMYLCQYIHVLQNFPALSRLSFVLLIFFLFIVTIDNTHSTALRQGREGSTICVSVAIGLSVRPFCRNFVSCPEPTVVCLQHQGDYLLLVYPGSMECISRATIGIGTPRLLLVIASVNFLSAFLKSSLECFL